MPDKIPVEQLDRVIRYNFTVVHDTIAQAEHYLRAGKLDAAAAHAQMAADYAWHNHPGFFLSERLEDVLFRISGAVRHEYEIWNQRRDDPSTVLHVLTQAYPVGGSTRFVWRWMQQDRGRRHSVALTRQGEMPVPDELLRAVKSSSGAVHFIDETNNLMSRAARLRRLAHRFDRIVLHCHPYDVVPALAFSGSSSRPPIASVNHADHLFWAGRNTADIVAHIRLSGAELGMRRRGIPPSKSSILPIPLLPSAHTSQLRVAARNKLGVAEGTIVLLSVASAYKYVPTGGPSIVEVLEPVLRRFPQAVLWIVGPGPDASWAQSELLRTGRVQLFGHRDDPSDFYGSADVYLDSFPFASLTSLLEAAANGTAVVSYRPHPDSCAVLCSDDPALSTDLIGCHTAEAFTARISQLIEDPEERSSMGKTISDHVRSVHIEQWAATARQLYAAAAASAASWDSSSEDAVPQFDGIDREVTRMQLKAGLARDRLSVMRSQIGLLPVRSRVALFLKLNHGKPTSPHVLLSELSRTRLRRSLIQARRLVAPSVS